MTASGATNVVSPSTSVAAQSLRERVTSTTYSALQAMSTSGAATRPSTSATQLCGAKHHAQAQARTAGGEDGRSQWCGGVAGHGRLL